MHLRSWVVGTPRRGRFEHELCLCCPHALNVDPCSFNGLDIRIPIIIPVGEGVIN